MTNNLSFEDFLKVEMRVGTIVDAKEFPGLKNPAYQLFIDFGEEIGVKKSSAQLTALYSLSDLIGKQVVAVVNFPKKQISTFMSECLVLGAVSGKEVTLLTPEKPVINGLRIS